jgi:catechol 2,3-dioxygenase-like lactoylglutathione lyase family enzyme
MTEESFQVQQIDHVELFVPDQYEAAKWYEEILGLKILPDYEYWAANGPLMISSNGGGTMLALFVGEPRGQRPTAGHHRVAFRVDAAGFIRFLARLADHPVYNERGQPLTPQQVIDHDLSYSIYFCDPYGNRYEITTYDYEVISAYLANAVHHR